MASQKAEGYDDSYGSYFVREYLENIPRRIWDWIKEKVQQKSSHSEGKSANFYLSVFQARIFRPKEASYSSSSGYGYSAKNYYNNDFS